MALKCLLWEDGSILPALHAPNVKMNSPTQTHGSLTMAMFIVRETILPSFQWNAKHARNQSQTEIYPMPLVDWHSINAIYGATYVARASKASILSIKAELSVKQTMRTSYPQPADPVAAQSQMKASQLWVQYTIAAVLDARHARNPFLVLNSTYTKRKRTVCLTTTSLHRRYVGDVAGVSRACASKWRNSRLVFMKTVGGVECVGIN